MTNPAREARLRAQAQWPGAIVAGRGPGWIKHQHPTDPRRFMLDVGVGNVGWHIQGTETEVDTAWLPDSGIWQWQMVLADYQARAKALFNGAPLVDYRIGSDFVTLQPRQLDWSNDRNDVQVAGTPQAISATANDDRLIWTGAYGAGRDFEWQTQTARLAKRVILQSYASLPAPNAQIMGGANPVLRPQFQFDYAATLTVYVDGQPWTGGNRPTLDTSQPIEFRRGDGSVAFAYNVPHVSDRSGEQPPSVVQRVSKSGNNLLVEVRVPQAWLANAVYPVVIDPTIDVKPTASNEDGNETSAGNVQIVSSTFNTDQTGEWQAARFAIPNPSTGLKSGATINTSYITANYATATLDEPDIIIYGEDVQNPGVYVAGTGTYTISGRTKTTATVDWASTDLGAPGDFNSPSLNSIVSELIASYDYEAGGYMAFLWTSKNGTSTRDAETTMYDGSTNLCWRLHIEYTAGSTTLAVQDATHSHTADNLAITQKQLLAVADAAHGHTVENIDLTQKQLLAVDDAAHAQTAENVTLVPSALSGTPMGLLLTITVAGGVAGITLIVQDAGHGHTAENVDLIQKQLLAVADASHAQAADNVALTQKQLLAVADASHGQTAENVALIQKQLLAVQDAAHSHTADNVGLIQKQLLAVADAAHSHSAENIALIQKQLLAVADALHSHTSDNVVLQVAGVTVLEVQDASHAQTAQNVDLVQAFLLLIADAQHAHSADDVALTQKFVLTVTDATHAQAADNVTLSLASLLIVADASHGHTAQNVELTQAFVITVADASHAQVSESVILIQHSILVVQDAYHIQTADELVWEIEEEVTSVQPDVRFDARSGSRPDRHQTSGRSRPGPARDPRRH